MSGFVDEAQLNVRGGDGAAGCVSTGCSMICGSVVCGSGSVGPVATRGVARAAATAKTLDERGGPK